VLLGEICAEGQSDLDASGLDPRELCADGPHQRLASEAVPDPALEGRIPRLKSR
jgi:hypothetical protein